MTSSLLGFTPSTAAFVRWTSSSALEILELSTDNPPVSPLCVLASGQNPRAAVANPKREEVMWRC